MKNNILTYLFKKELLTLTDVHFAEFISDLANEQDSDLALAAALTSHATLLQHVCLDLESVSNQILLKEAGSFGTIRCPSASTWRSKLNACAVVGQPGDDRPLILDQKNRLYLHRYWKYEYLLARQILEKVNLPDFQVDLCCLSDSLDRYFPESDKIEQTSYKNAVATACFKRFCVITGGPGTGKTTTAAKILAAILEQHGNEKFRIALAAPTGKSAIRLGESIRKIKTGLACPQWVKKAIPSDPQTIHRLLKPLSRSLLSFYHTAERLLPVDIVVVDEASMVDLALMSKLAQAVPQHARMILIGDKDQLASVEPGSVFSDICSGLNSGGHSKAWQNQLESVMQNLFTRDSSQEEARKSISDCIVNLDRNFRFEENADIHILCQTIQQGDSEALVRVFNKADRHGIRFQEIEANDAWIEILERNIIDGYSGYLKAHDPKSALEKFNRFKILCAIKKGPLGTEGINKRTEHILGKAGLIRPGKEWYRGRPVLITKNDYPLGLFNGDIGIVWSETKEADQRLLVYFFSESGELRHFLPHLLPEHETAYALTVHKSQGSEFESVIFLLPDHESPVITRELLYTGISRARNHVSVFGAGNIVKSALSRTICRNSGLRDMLDH